MPRGGSRQKSPCAPHSRRLPKYKQLARDLPSNARETLARHRYQTNPRGDRRPCVVVGDDAEGRTNCYHPTAHSTRRNTCNLLVDPASPLHDFRPDLYLVPGPRFRDETLVCTAVDILAYTSEDVDTRRNPPTQPVVVLGPFAHPVTGLLTVKCILLSALEEVDSLRAFGQAFQTMDMSERGAMVPDRDMIVNLYSDVQRSNLDARDRILSNLGEVHRRLSMHDRDLETLDDACAQDPAFQRRVRAICKNLYEMALYFRRYAGPGRKVPLDLLEEVGSASNPLSASLDGRFATVTAAGAVRLTTTGSGQSQAADYVMQPEGTLTNMSQAHANAVLAIYDALTPDQQSLVTSAFRLGTPFRIINGNGRFYLDTVDPNTYNGNPDYLTLNLFDMCYGTRDRPRGFFAVASVHGTREYCVQIAAIQIIRCVQTILPYVYRTRPAWALVDGEFDNVHT